MTRTWIVLLAALAPLQLAAHIGSPDVFHEGSAGPYRLLVTVRPPAVIPGVAEVEIRSATPGIERIRITPLPLTGPGAKFAPVPDLARQSKDDPQFFTGSLWMMTAGSWQVRAQAEGSLGSGTLSIPVPTLPKRTEGMQTALGTVLFALMLLLSAGIVSIIGAGSREGRLPPGTAPGEADRKRARRVMAVTAAIVLAVLYFGNQWWIAEANAYSRYIYKPLQMKASLLAEGKLQLEISDPGWIRSRQIDDLVPDHDHLMHLYVLRLPSMERVWHLHPELQSSGVFLHALPAMPAGRYQLYGDIVHRTGLAETLTAELEVPELKGAPLAGDDAAGTGPQLPDPRQITAAPNTATFPDGYRMVWLRGAEPLKARKLTSFRFQLQDANGKPAEGAELYLGMPGHAAFVKQDRSVFAHVHPFGSAAMAALEIAQRGPEPAATAASGHAMHAGHSEALPPEVSFPYGFPSAGAYRIFVQMKRSGAVLTGFFDAAVID